VLPLLFVVIYFAVRQEPGEADPVEPATAGSSVTTPETSAADLAMPVRDVEPEASAAAASASASTDMDAAGMELAETPVRDDRAARPIARKPEKPRPKPRSPTPAAVPSNSSHVTSAPRDFGDFGGRR
jgi:hypothetical protein